MPRIVPANTLAFIVTVCITVGVFVISPVQAHASPTRTMTTFCTAIEDGYIPESTPPLSPASPSSAQVYTFDRWTSDHYDIALWLAENASTGPLKSNLDGVLHDFTALLASGAALNKAQSTYQAHPTAKSKAAVTAATATINEKITPAGTALLIAMNHVATACAKLKLS
jgi:hypothetical protein